MSTRRIPPAPTGTGPRPLDPWSPLRQLTPARIALGRAGVSLPTARHLEFQIAHARARTAVHSELDIAALQSALGPTAAQLLPVTSQAPDRATYLQRPDLGRRLAPDSAETLRAARSETVPDLAPDLAIVLADGLSALATQSSAPPFLAALTPRLREAGLRLAPLTVATQARVALGDKIAQALGARMVMVLIGERPGLSAADSLGLYLTWNPRDDSTDADRNCLSNIRPGGLSFEDAAHRAAYLAREAMRLQLSGVGLKDRTETITGDATPDRIA
ncbi:ethanolamine ammonia-lyase subunit EutC [Pseudodonghicola flavimaris]|uniref:Ethanolamine ammonia-lyase small subunit n=1 Tax=Pseudodonghicola flavimaris TaxID=3050036 RepID=A0ABT7EYG2_9RHOB|nr:ethanolamine ammonia-lyase subunit EutC [Pseudodonghicola flavimaris]MDK3017387.1 ethanolamine ammonia-lyase subunit EutC [Pseudodonghicola flavimaris]